MIIHRNPDRSVWSGARSATPLGNHTQTLPDVHLGSQAMRNRASSPTISGLTVFAFIWACQALVHQEFYSGWVDGKDWAGWLVTILGVVVLLRPSSLSLFAALLLSSVVYNVRKWPFVVNHILVESVINSVVLGAIIWSVWEGRGRRDAIGGAAVRARAVDRFAPVARLMLLVMYYFAVVAKLNFDFIDPEYSCVTAMYDDLLRRFSFLPTGRLGELAAIWGTVAIELAIPLLLTFRRTRWLGIAIGLPFHLMLGLIGHRTFSALAYGVYSLFLIDELTSVVRACWARAQRWFGETGWRRVLLLCRFGIGAGVAVLVALDLTGHYRAGVGPFRVYRAAWAIWIFWSLALMALYATAIRLQLASGAKWVRLKRAASPGLLWAAVVLVILNGLSQYLGLKTETCFTMYSNLRTEAGINNHLFMPAFRLAQYQDDLVDIVTTSHPTLQRAVNEQKYITYFELRRVISTSTGDFEVTYRRGGKQHRYAQRGGVPNDAALAAPLNRLLAKVLYFRPVPKSVHCPCQH